jgi:hypothetical protein
MNGPLPTPDLAAILDMKVQEIFSLLNCHQLGTIEDFNAETQTATVSLSIKLNFGDTLKTYPVLKEVPVFVLGGGNRVITIPIIRGDTCLVLFNDRDIDIWTQTGAAALPSSDRQHDISDGLALVGFRSKANPVGTYSNNDVEIRNGQNKIAVGDKLLFKNSTTDLLTVLQLAATALTALDTRKIGSTAAPEITAFKTQLALLLKST